MRYTLLLLLFLGCKEQSIQDKLIEASERYDKKLFKSLGEDIESFNIDSFSYREANLADLYKAEGVKYLNRMNGSKDLINVDFSTKDTSTFARFSETDKATLAVLKKLYELSQSPDAKRPVYWLKYYRIVKTDRKTYEQSVQRFVSQPGLQVLAVDYDYLNESSTSGATEKDDPLIESAVYK
jgi:hypothetical protein